MWHLISTQEVTKWNVIDKSSAYNQTTGQYRLCLKEKWYKMFRSEGATLNLRSDLRSATAGIKENTFFAHITLFMFCYTFQWIPGALSTKVFLFNLWWVWTLVHMKLFVRNKWDWFNLQFRNNTNNADCLKTDTHVW